VRYVIIEEISGEDRLTSEGTGLTVSYESYNRHNLSKLSREVLLLATVRDG